MPVGLKLSTHASTHLFLQGFVHAKNLSVHLHTDFCNLTLDSRRGVSCSFRLYPDVRGFCKNLEDKKGDWLQGKLKPNITYLKKFPILKFIK